MLLDRASSYITKFADCGNRFRPVVREAPHREPAGIFEKRPYIALMPWAIATSISAAAASGSAPIIACGLSPITVCGTPETLYLFATGTPRRACAGESRTCLSAKTVMPWPMSVHVAANPPGTQVLIEL